MSAIKHIEKIPEEVRELVEAGLGSALKKGSLGKTKINYIQIENSLSGGKTGAVVFVARYGLDDSVKKTKKETKGSSFIRVLKIAPKDVCESENEGYVKTRETLLDIFSQIEYYPEDEFEYTKNQYGILLYQDVGTVAASDLKGVARYLTAKIESLPPESEEGDKFSRELSLLLQKEVFLSLKKGLYGTIKRKDVNLSEFYGDKLNSKKVEQGLKELIELDSTIPGIETIREYFNINSTYHEVNYVHGDLNPENVLVWENERGFLSCKLIDFGEVMPKKRENFTPLFWDFSRLIGEMILNTVESIMPRYTAGKEETGGTRQPDINEEAGHRVISEGNLTEMTTTNIDTILNEFWNMIESYFRGGGDIRPDIPAGLPISFIAKIYISTLFDFINEAKSGLKDLRRAEVVQDYFYCQILFYLFYTKFQNEDKYKRLFSAKLALKMADYVRQDAPMDALIQSLEKFYFDFTASQAKNREPVIGPAPGARSPFMGLSYFQEKDREYFFGREKFTEELVKQIEEKPITALAGASGSGKSSVIHAGVIPVLREKGYMVFKFRPGTNPYLAAVRALHHPEGGKTFSRLRDDDSPELTDIIKSILNENPGKRIFLLGDQFEELFTLCTDQRQREDLGTALIECAKEFKDRFRFLLTIRSDFWTKLIEDAGFASVVGDSGSNKELGAHFFLNPMNVEELRSAIEKPLAAAKLHIQDGLTDLILTSIAKEPGSLPLLEFCLEELWKKQVDYTLNYNAYKEIGEVKGALAAYAENVYSSLGDSEKESLKKIMLQLVQPGQGTEDTRRVALVEEISHPLEGEKTFSRLQGENANVFLYHLADKRLIVTGTNEEGKQTIEVVHEALIREWKRLKEWINADREFRVWQEKVRYAEKEWNASNREEELLLHGSSIAAAEDWYKSRKEDLSRREIEYIETSIAERDRILREKEEARERELQRELEAEKKAKKTQRIITIGSVAAAVLAIGLSWWALDQKEEAVANGLKSEAILLQSNYESKKDYMQSYYEMLTTAIKGAEVSDKLSVQKIKIFSTLYDFIYRPQTPEVYSRSDQYKEENFFTFAFTGERMNLAGHSNYVNSVTFSPDGKIIASGSYDNTIKLWDASSGKELKTLSGHSNTVSSVTFSPDGKTIASGSSDNNIKLWDASSGKELKTLSGHSNSVISVTFSPDGKTIASGSSDNNIKLWDASSGKELKTLSGHSNSVKSVTFSPDGKTIASGSSDKNIKLWDVTIQALLPLACEDLKNQMEHWVSLKERSPYPLKEIEDVQRKCEKILAEKPAVDLAEVETSLYRAAKSDLAQFYFERRKETEAFALEEQKEYLYLYRARKADGDKKIADYQEALKINPKLQPAKVDLVSIYSASAGKACEEKDYQNCFSYYKKGIELDSENDRLIDGLAWQLATKENPTSEELKEALEYSKKSNDLSPDNASYLDTLAEVYLKQGDKYNARKFNEKAKKLAEENKDEKLLKGIAEREGRLK